MVNDDIAENVLRNGKDGIKQNMIQVLEEFVACYADEMWQIVSEVIKLREENAALRERLDKSIILPCKVGDIIYIITFGYNGKHVTPNNFADCWSYGMKEVEVTEENLFIMCSHFRDGSAFFDRASAEARLAELKGGKYENF